MLILNGCLNDKVPTVTAVSPASVPVGSGDTQVTVTGSGLRDHYIQVGTAPAYSTYTKPYPTNIDTSVTLTVPAAQFATGGSLPIVVLNDAPGTLNSQGYFKSSVVLTVSVPAPTISSVSPSSVVVGVPQTITITGSGYLASSVAAVNGVAHTTKYLSSTQVSFDLTAADVSTAGTLGVTVSNAAAGGTVSASASVTVLRILPSEYHAYGDSITYGLTLAQVTSAYPYLLANARSLTVKDLGISGIETCPIFANEVNATDPAPTVKNNILFSEMSGTNDLYINGTGAHEAVFNTCQQGIIAWLGTPVEFRIAPGSSAFAASGGCATTGFCSSGAAGTISTSITTTGAPVYLWYELNDNAAATMGFAYTVDGVAQGTYLSRPAGGISKNGATTGIGFVRVPAGAGVHSLSVVTATGGIHVYGFGSLPATAYGTQPTILLGDLPNQAKGREVNPINDQQVYSGDIRANVALLARDGIDVRLVPTRRYLLGDSSEFSSSEIIHPNELGQQHLEQAFDATLGTLGTKPSLAPVLVSGSVTALPIADLEYVAPASTSSFSMPSVATAGRGITVYNNSTSGAHALISAATGEKLQPYNSAVPSAAVDLDVGHSATFYPDTANGQYLVYVH